MDVPAVEPSRWRGSRTTAASLRRRIRLSPPLVAGALLLGLIFGGAIFAPIITHWTPMTQALLDRLKPPAWSPGGVAAHPLGTDSYGRDVLSQLMYGARYSLAAAIAATAVSGALGVTLGLVAGYGGGWPETAIMRAVDAMMALPAVLLALMVVGIYGDSYINLLLILAVTGWSTYTRILFGIVRSLRGREFVTATVALGATSSWILRRHISPNILSPIIVISTLQVGRMMLLEAGLSFLGLGLPDTIPAWGNMLAEGERNIFNAGYLSTVPGLAITITVLSVNLLGDGLRRALDPHLRNV